MIGKFTTLLWVFASVAATAATAVTVPDVPVNGTTASLLGTGVGAIVYAALALRKRMSSDGLGVKANTSAGDMLDRLTRERDEAAKDARAAWASKNADSLELGTLRAENAYLKEQLRVNHELVATIRKGVQNVGQQVDNVKNRMAKTEARLTNSGNAPLDQ